MCHHMTWEEWQLLQDEKRREDVEPRVVRSFVSSYRGIPQIEATSPSQIGIAS